MSSDTEEVSKLRVRFIKTHPDAQLPSSAHEGLRTGDSGFDVYAVEDVLVPAKSSAKVDVGLELAFISPGIWVRCEARSGLSFKSNIIPHFGVYDNGYRGPCHTLLYNLSDKDYQVKKGDRIAQFVIYPLIRPVIEWAEEKVETERFEKGIGSSGR